MTSKNMLLDMYISSNQEWSSTRASLKKYVTAYNKLNKSDPLTMVDLFQRDYPRLLNCIRDQSKLDPSKVIENSFNKLLKNLSTKQTSRPESLMHTYLSKAYPPGTLLIHRINNLKYTIRHSQYGYPVAHSNDFPTLEVWLPDFLILFKEV